MTASNILNDHGALEVRLAARLASSLLATELPHDVSERLRVAREQTVTRARQLRLAAVPNKVATTAPKTSQTAVLGVSKAGAATLGGGAPSDEPGHWQNWLASMLPLLLLVAGLLFISQWSAREQVLAAAEIDTLLLADDLPPAAYADPGFAEYLRTGPLR